MSQHKVHFKTIAEFNAALGMPKPEHPLFSISFKDRFVVGDTHTCGRGGITHSSDFYTIAIKKIISGEMHYGRTKYDFSNGSLMFTAPRQEITCNELVITSDAVIMAVHEDFIRGHPIQKAFKKYGFFSYAVNEALHLSPKEEHLVRSLMNNIHTEYHGNQDEFSKELILSQVDTLLKYANRFYKRQFLNREPLSHDIVVRFEEAIQTYFDSGRLDISGTPKIEDIADEMGLSPRYLSDTLKTQTGKSALEHIHLYLLDEAKNLLLQSDTTVAEVAYQLGFDYPQYFSRLFKKKVGISPKEYREQNIVH